MVDRRKMFTEVCAGDGFFFEALLKSVNSLASETFGRRISFYRCFFFQFKISTYLYNNLVSICFLSKFL